MGTTHARKILIVEDDDILGRALTNVIRREADVSVATTIAAAKRSLKLRVWDALILDVGLPDGDGLDFLAWARDGGIHTPALVITGRYEPALANRADLLDAQFAFKPDILPNVKAFVERVRATASEAETTDRAVKLAEQLARQARMTVGEIEVVRLVALGVPRAGLAAHLKISENTVKTRVRGLLEKAAMPNLEALARAILAAVAREATTQSGEGATVRRRG